MISLGSLPIPDSYVWGVFGSLAVEVGAALRLCVEEDYALPRRYKSTAYLVIRLLVAMCGGMLALVLDGQTIYAAFYLGASAPLFLEKLAQGVDVTKR